MKMRTESSTQQKTESGNPITLSLKLLREGPSLPRLVFILLSVWAVSLVLSIPLGGFYAFDEAFVIATLYKLLALCITVPFAYRFLVLDRRDSYFTFRKYLGYAGVVGYFAMAMPALAWEDARYVTHDGAMWFWAINFWITALLSAAWVALYSLRGRAHFGLITVPEIKNRKLRIEMRKKRESKRPRRKIWQVVTENVDQFIQVVLMVIVLQTFIFQLYVIPSESLVPTMLIGDRPFVVKTLDGPPMPLSNVRFPAVSQIERNNIVVFESPAAEKLPLMKQVFNQFVFLLTLSLVNLDTDASGNPTERMIVKRVIGVPGDRLTMIDDKVYIAGADGNFKLLDGDDRHANVNLQRLPAETQSQIQDLPIDETYRGIFDKWDAARRDIDINATKQIIAAASAKIQKNLSALSAGNLESFARFIGAGSQNSAENRRISLLAEYNNQPWRYMSITISQEELDYYLSNYKKYPDFRTKFFKEGLENDDFQTVYALARDPKLLEAFIQFLKSSPAGNDGGMYGTAIRAVNLLHQKSIAERFAALSDLLVSQTGFASYPSDSAYAAALLQGAEFAAYVVFFDMRNFPSFPAEGTIPPNHYFLMGDNRYNSLDFRFDMNSRRVLRPLDAEDPNSLIYLSMLAPRLLERERIIGHVVFRLFPLNRLGTVP